VLHPSKVVSRRYFNPPLEGSQPVGKTIPTRSQACGIKVFVKDNQSKRDKGKIEKQVE
jgi:hypothetical protein